jgi:ADP-ribosylarginine hydrolase
MEKNLKNKILASILLGVMGDVIGFGNGLNEFNNNNRFTLDNSGDNFANIGSEYSNELVFNFIADGGFNSHPKPFWTVSDDSIMLFCNIDAIITWYNSDEEKDITNLVNYIRLEYINIIKDKIDLEKFERVYQGGLNTIKYLKKLKNGDDYKTFVYDGSAGGSGGCMRSMIFGCLFYKEEDILKLIECSIESTVLTHPNAIAFLGSVVVALFASYAFRNIEPNRWCVNMLETLESTIIDEYIKTSRESFYPFYERDKKIFINKWKDYQEDKIDEYNYTYKKCLSMKYPAQRSLYYNKYSAKTKEIYPGAGGDDSVIISYDCLLDANNSWDKIVFYSMLHVGDSDTTGIITGFLYGAYYGSDNVYDKMKDNLIDHKKKINETAIELYNIIKR